MRNNLKTHTTRVLKNLDCSFEIDDLIKAIGKTAHNRHLQQEIHWAHETLQSHTQAKAAVGLYPVEMLNDKKVVIYGADNKKRTFLNIGAKADLLLPARLSQISVITLGPKIDRLRKDVWEKGQRLRSYVLDLAGVLALKKIGQSINQIAEKEAVRRGWKVGYRMSPGSLTGWSLKDQRTLCDLLPLETIGVQILPSAMLSPLKSVAALIGIGPEYSSLQVKLTCKWCRHKSDCIIR